MGCGSYPERGVGDLIRDDGRRQQGATAFILCVAGAGAAGPQRCGLWALRGLQLLLKHTLEPSIPPNAAMAGPSAWEAITTLPFPREDLIVAVVAVLAFIPAVIVLNFIGNAVVSLLRPSKAKAQ